MRKDKQNFIKVYEGDNSYCSINNLEYNTDYEFRIFSIFNNIIGHWTDIQKIKTMNCDSIILRDLQKKMYFYKKCWNGVDLKKWN